MNSTSFGSRLVRIAARSPGRSSTGPEVWRRFTPISRAMMWASVVLPRPGGPNRRTWSSASLRRRAASMKTESCPRIFSCPTYSSSSFGRSVRSSASSCTEAGAVEIRRSVSIMSLLRKKLQGLPYALGNGDAGGQLLESPPRLAFIIAKRKQRIGDVARLPVALCRRRRRRHRVELVTQFQQQALGGLSADAGYLRQPAAVLGTDGLAQVRDGEPGQDGERCARPDSGYAQELAERPPFGLGGEAEQLVRILAHDQVGVERDFGAGRGQLVEGAHRHVELVSHALHVHHDLRRVLLDEPAVDAPDHGYPKMEKALMATRRHIRAICLYPGSSAVPLPSQTRLP